MVGCASGGGDDNSATGDDATSPVDATSEDTNDAHTAHDSGAVEAQADSAPPAEGSQGDDATNDGPPGDDGGTDGTMGDTGGPGTDSGSNDASDATSGVDAADSAVVDANDASTMDSPPDSPAAPIAFVQQVTALTGGTATSLSVTFAQTPRAGDLLVIAVGWTDTSANLTGVTDSAGNTYHLAVGPTTYAPDLEQSIWYASGVAATASTKITATFNTAAAAVDLRAAEYSGLSTTAPLDATAKGSGKSTAANSGSATTTAAPELLFAAGMCSDTYSTTPTPGFTMRKVTSNGNMFEDRIVSSTGSYSATATMASSTVEWVVQLATFR
jgi:hypothetical protein